MEGPLSARSALLQALALPGYGLELIERIHRATDGLVRLRMGSLYPALGRLEAAGLVRSLTVRAAGGPGRPRRYFELTPRGVAAASRERLALRRLLRGEQQSVPGEAAQAMAARLRRAARLSGTALKLRRGVSIASRGRSGA